MLEPLSESLRSLLFETQICSEYDLRRARRYVRQLAHDLPAFDSVWLDALVQIGRLTPYQARLLQSAHPEQIRLGPCVVRDRIGGGAFGETFLAKPVGGDELCVLKYLPPSERVTLEKIEQIEQFVAVARSIFHAALVIPRSCFRLGSGVVLVGEYVRGPCLAELLVRRGRFPVAVVWEIGRQLLSALDALAHRNLAHGDVRAANVRLTRDGTAVLIDAGIRAILDDGLLLHSGLPPERYDGIAPELTVVGGSVNGATDAYAVGCLLWQLLAGRPPFLGGDPLLKLAAHQTRKIEDVRRWAPDVPEQLAIGIARLTARSPADRPQQFSELLNAWGAPTAAGRRILSAFRRRFDAPTSAGSTGRSLSTPTRWLFVAASLFALSGAVTLLTNQGARNIAASWVERVSHREESTLLSQIREGESKNKELGPAQQRSGATSKYAPLPKPDRRGVVRLDSAGPYQAADLTVVGALSIVGDDLVSPRIIVSGRPFKLCAESIRLKNVRIEFESGGVGGDFGLLTILRLESQHIALEDCVVSSGRSTLPPREPTDGPSFSPPTGPALVAWKLIEPGEPRGGTATIYNTLFSGDGPALYLKHAARCVTCDNLLKLGTGPLIQTAAVPTAKSPLEVKISHSALRDSGPVLRWIVSADSPDGKKEIEPPAGAVTIEHENCVFDVVSPRAALLELASARTPPTWLRAIRIKGQGSLGPSALEVAGWVSTVTGQLTPLDSAEVEVEGIAACEFRFSGEATNFARDSEITSAEVPRSSSSLPGIRAESLPRLVGP